MWSLIALAACRSCSQSSSSATDVRALGPDRGGGVGEVPAQLASRPPPPWPRAGRRACRGRSASADRVRLGPGLQSARSAGHAPAPVDARISARCMVRTPVRCRLSAPPMCIRHELSAAHSTSARVCLIAATLSAQIAADTSAFLTANVPPNPQHVSASGRSARSRPPDRPQQPQRGVADVHHPQRMAGRVVGHPVREVRADVGHPEHAGQERGQVVHPRRDLGHLPPEGGVARLGRQHRVILAHHRARRTPTG